MTFEIQLRSEVSGLVHVNTLAHAFQRVEHDKSFWKISFTLPSGERVRLVRYAAHEGSMWIYEPLEIVK